MVDGTYIVTMRNPFRRDLVLLHPPAVYDFRTKPAFFGPLADAVPSTAMFEMYPVGLTSIAAFLERNHYNVEIVNLAYRMLQDPRFDVVEHLRRMSAPVFGIDLHWLPHVQGALSVIELVKELHPESRTLVGGLSASYYHDELVRYPFVDFVLRGDSMEEPARQLLQALRESRPLETVENLTWKRPDGTVVVNPLTFVPKDLDYVDVPAYRYDYAEHLLDRFGLDGRVHPFVAPLGPFLDPGCRAFEQADFGHKRFCHTLEDHRRVFLGWHEILSYETNAMTRDEIVRANRRTGQPPDDVWRR